MSAICKCRGFSFLFLVYTLSVLVDLSNAIIAVLEDTDIRVRTSAVKALSKFKKCDDDVLWGLSHKMGRTLTSLQYFTTLL